MTFLTPATQSILRPINLSRHDRLSLELDRDGNKFIASIYQVSQFSDTNTFPSHYASVTFPARIAERKRLAFSGPEHQWAFAATDSTAAVIDALWPKHQVEMSEEAALVYNYLMGESLVLTQNAKRVAQFKEDGTLDVELTDHPDHPLAGYQRLAAYNAIHSEYYAHFMEQGTGKTPVVIAQVCNEAEALYAAGGDAGAIKKAKSKGFDLVRAVTADADEKYKEMMDAAGRKADRFEEKLVKAVHERYERETVSLSGSAVTLMRDARRKIDEIESRLRDSLAVAKSKAAANREDVLHAAVKNATDLSRRMIAEAEAQAADLVENVKTDTSTPRMYRAIIVCPNNVRMNWASEFEKFKTCEGMVTVLRGGEIQRVKKLIDACRPNGKNCKFTAIICSYDTLAVSWKMLKMFEWDLAVLDESHYIKSPTTRRFKFACKVRDNARKRVILTGTPITNHVLDLYGQFEFLGKGASGFMSWKNFRSFYGVYTTTGEGHKKLVSCQNMPFIQERLARTSFMITKDEALPDLPEKVYDVEEVEMTTEQAKYYEQMRVNLAIEIENDLKREDNKQLVATNILTKLLRLAQITSGFVTWDGEVSDEGEVIKEKEIERLPNNPKIEALIRLLAEKPSNEKMLIWACWVSDIKAIQKALEEAGHRCVSYYGGVSEKEREENVYAFNHDPSVRVFIGNAAAGGVGLNLLGYPPGQPEASDSNANHVVYYSQNWSPTARSQSEDRCHRRGTRENIRVTDLCVPGTIDEEIRARVLDKRINAYKIQDVRDILASVLKGDSNG
jgi:hypothetical protein